MRDLAVSIQHGYVSDSQEEDHRTRRKRPPVAAHDYTVLTGTERSLYGSALAAQPLHDVTPSLPEMREGGTTSALSKTERRVLLVPRMLDALAESRGTDSGS